MIGRSAVMAGFMYENPDVQVYDFRAKCFYYFSSLDNNFYYVRDNNPDKSFRAYGLDSALIQYIEWRGV